MTLRYDYLGRPTGWKRKLLAWFFPDFAAEVEVFESAFQRCMVRNRKLEDDLSQAMSKKHTVPFWEHPDFSMLATDPNPVLTERRTSALLIEQGREYYRGGLPITSCPNLRFPEMALDWQNGWRWEKEEHDVRKARSAINHAYKDAREALANEFAKDFPAVLAQYNHYKIVDWFVQRLRP